MPTGDVLSDNFNLDSFDLGLSGMGNIILWVVISLFLLGIAGGFFIHYFTKKTYKHKIIVYGMMGNAPRIKWRDTAKEVPMGKAGDKLYYLRQKKRYLPLPTLQMGYNEWWFWEREDGELINITIEDLDTKQKALGIKFIESDMRLQRLGIEKNLAFRLQKQSFWDKYGDKIVNILFYVIVSLLLIVIFVEWQKTAVVLNEAVQTAGEVLKEVNKAKSNPNAPATVTPALVLLLIGSKSFFRRKWRLPT